MRLPIFRDGRLYRRFCICAGNGHYDEPAEGRQSLFSWAEFLAGKPAQPQGRNGKLKPSSLSLFQWALNAGQEREKEPIGAGR